MLNIFHGKFIKNNVLYLFLGVASLMLPLATTEAQSTPLSLADASCGVEMSLYQQQCHVENEVRHLAQVYEQMNSIEKIDAVVYEP